MGLLVVVSAVADNAVAAVVVFADVAVDVMNMFVVAVEAAVAVAGQVHNHILAVVLVVVLVLLDQL